MSEEGVQNKSISPDRRSADFCYDLHRLYTRYAPHYRDIEAYHYESTAQHSIWVETGGDSLDTVLRNVRQAAMYTNLADGYGGWAAMGVAEFPFYKTPDRDCMEKAPAEAVFFVQEFTTSGSATRRSVQIRGQEVGWHGLVDNDYQGFSHSFIGSIVLADGALTKDVAEQLKRTNPTHRWIKPRIHYEHKLALLPEIAALGNAVSVFPELGVKVSVPPSDSVGISVITYPGVPLRFQIVVNSTGTEYLDRVTAFAEVCNNIARPRPKLRNVHKPSPTQPATPPSPRPHHPASIPSQVSHLQY